MRDAAPFPYTGRQHRLHPQRAFRRTMWLSGPSTTEPSGLEPHPRSTSTQKSLRAPSSHPLRRLPPRSATTATTTTTTTAFFLRPRNPTNRTLPFISSAHPRPAPPQKPPRPAFVVVIVVFPLAISEPLRRRARPAQSQFQRRRQHERCACRGRSRARPRHGHLPGHRERLRERGGRSIRVRDLPGRV